jgi:hypothetical protein
MNLKTQFLQYLDKNLPMSKYSNGDESHCLIHRIANLFDALD